MGLLFNKLSVPKNSKGFLFVKNRLVKELEPGMSFEFDPFRFKTVWSVPTVSMLTNVENQEVLSKDNIAFRFSYVVSFKISNARKYIESVRFSDKQERYFDIVSEAHNQIRLFSQTVIRDQISELSSEEINQKRSVLLDGCRESIQPSLEEFGIELEQVLLRDLTFPKNIQNLFALELESKIRAKSDLENARTRVAAARSLKNAAEMLKGDKNVQFMQYLETIQKIASNGRHTFVIGEGKEHNS